MMPNIILKSFGAWQSLKTWSQVRTNAHKPPKKVVPNTDLWYWLALILGLSLVFVYSATIALPDAQKSSIPHAFYYVERHIFSIALAMTAMAVVKDVPMKFWERWAPHIFIFALFLLLLVIVPGVGKWVKGAKRWLPLGIMNFQPSELAKLAIILYGSNYIVRKMDKMRSFTQGVLPLITALIAAGFLLLLEPDMGAFLVMSIIVGGILFLGGAHGRLFTLLILSCTFVFSAIIYFSPWRRERIFAYLSPWDSAYVLSKGYQLTLSLIAFGRGGMWGEGIGGSIQKLHYLPEAHTDFIMAIIGEELGLMGVLLMIALFFYFVRRVFMIGRTAWQFQRPFAGLVAQSIGIWVGAQVFINMGVNLGLLPTKGLTLPFISYGGSAILMNCIALGMVMRINQENHAIMRGEDA